MYKALGCWKLLRSHVHNWKILRRNTLKLFIGSILLLAGDISSNPGPSSSSCGICTMSVLESHKGVQCDSCDLWFHTSCCRISDSSYCRLANSTCIWICPNCGLHNLASFSAFSGSDSTLNASNSFQPLLYEYDSIANNVHINHPLASSTPTKASTPPSHRTSLCCLEINCNSIQSSERSAVFTSIIANQDPDIVFGCESKLSPEDPTYSSFPPNYNVFRKERVNSGGGGIFIAVKSSIPASELPDISTNPEDESLSASVHLAKQKTLYMCAFYKPPSASSSRLDYLSESILKVFNANKKSHPYIVVSGDFNCGDIDWKCDSPVVTNHSTAPLMNKLLDLINDHALTQHVSLCPHVLLP